MAPRQHQYRQPAQHESHHGHPPDETAEEREAQAAPLTPIPPLTDEDRAAAFPEVVPPETPDDAIHYLASLDQLEWSGREDGFGVDSGGWVGTDRNRIWFRVEGGVEGGALDHAETELLYGRAISTFFDFVAGVRQDFGSGLDTDSSWDDSWVATGFHGLAPYWFEIEAMAYIGPGGRLASRFEAEQDLLITNWVILQPEVELQLMRGGGPEDASAIVEAGVRLRYEIRREFAPYLGLNWERAFGAAADHTDANAAPRPRVGFVAGLRLWF